MSALFFTDSFLEFAKFCFENGEQCFCRTYNFFSSGFASFNLFHSEVVLTFLHLFLRMKFDNLVALHLLSYLKYFFYVYKICFLMYVLLLHFTKFKNELVKKYRHQKMFYLKGQCIKSIQHLRKQYNALILFYISN